MATEKQSEGFPPAGPRGSAWACSRSLTTIAIAIGGIVEIVPMFTAAARPAEPWQE